jgi:hypothetical protein
MKTKGIRISDIKDGKCIPLGELLETIQDETQFFWAWLWLDVTPLENEGHYLVELQKKTSIVTRKIKKCMKHAILLSK